MNVPDGPIETDPIDVYRGAEFTEVRELLEEAVEGIELGAYDRRIVDWLKDMADQPTIVVIASLLRRAREASQ